MNREIDISAVRLQTERLVLRAWRENDLDDFYEYAKVDGVGQMAGWVPHKDKDESRRILGSFIEGKRVLAIEYEGKVIGSLGIELYEEKNYPELRHYAGREIGYVLSKDYWGRGIMPEAVRAVIDYLFGEVGLDFILVGHFDWNRQSARVIEKCGFRYIKTCPFETRYDTIESSVEYILFAPDRLAGTGEHFMQDYQFTDDAALVQEVYRRHDEQNRLTGSPAAQVEFLTTVRYIDKYLRPGMRILDIGAGTGEYSLYYSGKGYEVSAVELSESNLQVFRSRLSSEDKIDLREGNALDLSCYEDESFDIVLLFGPLYHLHDRVDRLRCISEAKRVCKPDGKLFFAFIANDIVILTMFSEVPDYFISGAYDKESFRLVDFPFVFHTLDACRELLGDGGVRLLHEVAADGVSELMQRQINAMDAESYLQYLRYHYYICEKPECLGMSNHLLFVGEKQ